MSLTSLVLTCSLKKSPTASSSELLGRQLLDQLTQAGAPGEILRVADFDVRPGVTTDEGDGDEWPRIRATVLAADILVIATPIWLGHLSSIGARVLERLDAEIAETDDEGRPSMYGKVAAAAIVGNEDGAHHVSAEIFQGLSDVGFTVPPGGPVYWVGEAMQMTDYQDLSETPEKVATVTKTVAKNAAHLASLLQRNPFPA